MKRDELRFAPNPEHLRAATESLERLLALCGDTWGPSTRAYWQTICERADLVQGLELRLLMENLVEAVREALRLAGAEHI